MSDDGGDGLAAVAPLSVQADLRLTLGGATADVTSTGEVVFVDLATVPDALRALRARPEGGEGPLDAVLRTTDLRVEVRVRGRTVAVAGADARPGLVSRALDVEPLEVRPAGLLGAAGAEVDAGVSALVRRLS